MTIILCVFFLINLIVLVFFTWVNALTSKALVDLWFETEKRKERDSYFSRVD